jgi:hypothetical protein
MSEEMLDPAAVAFVDQLEVDTLALVRIGRNGLADVRRFHMSYADCAAALRYIADGLDERAAQERGGDQ